MLSILIVFGISISAALPVTVEKRAIFNDGRLTAGSLQPGDAGGIRLNSNRNRRRLNQGGQGGATAVSGNQ